MKIGSIRRWGFAIGGSGVLCAAALTWKVVSDYQALPPMPSVSDLSVSTVVLDRNDRLLRAFTSEDSKWRLPVDPAGIDPLYFEMLQAYEDKRFRSHGGVDIRALGRAFFQALKNGRLVSGGSTLTMQVARLLEETPTKTVQRKYLQILKAVQLEQTATKDEILHLYALRAPFGGNVEGVRAASLIWFGKEPRRLTPAEAALLVALPQSPERRRPDRFPENAKNARNRVLARAVSAGVLDLEEAQSAAREPLRAKRHAMPILAAHESRHARLGSPKQAVLELTLDRDVQQALESLARRRISVQPIPLTLAMVVADHQTGDILASVGSPDLLDEGRAGHVDMTRSIRSPGSTLKPYIYGLAFEEGIGQPESLIVDRPTNIGGYRPTNFDLAYQGTVTLREALQLSLNTPAVQLLEAVGPSRLLARLKRAGIRPTLETGQGPGLAIGLGGIGLSLRDLTQSFAALARQGDTVHLRSCRSSCPGTEVSGRKSLPVLPEKAAWQVTEALSGLPQPLNPEKGLIAYKTGTSYGYRDAWAVGYDGRYVVGVWSGRADGSPVPGQTGATAAVPILFEAFQSLSAGRRSLPQPPHGYGANGPRQVPEALRYARVKSRPDQKRRESRLGITFPPNGAEIQLERRQSGSRDPLVVKFQGGQRPYRLFVNGAPVGEAAFDQRLLWSAPETGFANLMILDAAGHSSKVSVTIESKP
ncbi:penicillin-binding protein 1C [Labrenzia sp. PHM005]|nr:penicillin-binding protein 1C [Labrenzia sp. PHM005]